MTTTHEIHEQFKRLLFAMFSSKSVFHAYSVLIILRWNCDRKTKLVFFRWGSTCLIYLWERKLLDNEIRKFVLHSISFYSQHWPIGVFCLKYNNREGKAGYFIFLFQEQFGNFVCVHFFPTLQFPYYHSLFIIYLLSYFSFISSGVL